MASKNPLLVYTDHSASRTLPTGLNNDAHGRIAGWQERLGNYDMPLLHRSAKTHFLGIAHSFSRLPTSPLQHATMDDAKGLSPQIANVVAITGLATDVMVYSGLAIALRSDLTFWDMRNEWRVTLEEAELENLKDEGLDSFHWHTVCLQERESQE